MFLLATFGGPLVLGAPVSGTGRTGGSYATGMIGNCVRFVWITKAVIIIILSRQRQTINR